MGKMRQYTSQESNHGVKTRHGEADPGARTSHGSSSNRACLPNSLRVFAYM
jgi:hypothetical protein